MAKKKGPSLLILPNALNTPGMYLIFSQLST